MGEKTEHGSPASLGLIEPEPGNATPRPAPTAGVTIGDVLMEMSTGAFERLRDMRLRYKNLADERNRRNLTIIATNTMVQQGVLLKNRRTAELVRKLANVGNPSANPANVGKE